MSDSHGFPWDFGKASRTQRWAFAFLVALFAAGIQYVRPAGNGGLSDFSMLWYGSRILLNGGNPYELIGPSRLVDLPSSLYYPAPALVAVTPFTVLPVEVAGAAFIFVSALLLAYAITADGWHRIPALASVSFFTSARLGQWSILMAAALFLPAIAFVSVAKPQASLPVVASSPRRSTLLLAGAGALLLSTVSWIAFPGWIAAWISNLTTAEYFHAPILSVKGMFIALVLLRWRRPEAWLVFVSACIPQTWYAYNALILLFVADSYRENCVLSLLSSAGWLAVYMFAPGEWRSDEIQSTFSWVMILFCYLPATVLVLKRPNTGEGTAWMRLFRPSTPTKTSPAS